MTPVIHYNLEGIWLVDDRSLGEPCILVIMSDGRTIQFPTSQTRPQLNQTLRLWHSEYDGREIRFRPSPTAKGWLRAIEPAENGWVMIAVEDGVPIRFHCSPLATEDLPNWYENMLVKNLARMKEIEFNTPQINQQNETQ